MNAYQKTHDGILPSVLSKTAKSSYGQILKSSFIVGGSSLLSIFLGVIRTKCLAILLGPSGVGLIGIFNSITGPASIVAGMGMSASGVRQIAEAAGTGDKVAIARTIITLRWTALAFGVVGALLLFSAANPIAHLTFGDTSYAGAVAILSVAVLLTALADAQTALVQGMRLVGDFARITILSAFWSTLLGVPMVFLLGQNGIVPLLLTVPGTAIITSWWYARKIDVPVIRTNWREVLRETKGLVRLGFVFMIDGLLITVAAYLTRLIIVRKLGIEAVGFYQAAWALSGLGASFILGAMAADFYPRLTAVAKNNQDCSRLVNEQTEVALLLAVPGVLATIVFAPLVISVFYSGKFDPAIDILRWQILGVLLRVAGNPIGLILLAKGAGKLFLLMETLSHLVFVLGMWFCIDWFGLSGTGIAYFALYSFAWIFALFVVRRSFDFSWSTSNRHLAFLITPIVVISFLLPIWFSPLWAMIVGGIITVVVGILFLWRLVNLVGVERLPFPFKRVLGKLGILEISGI